MRLKAAAICMCYVCGQEPLAREGAMFAGKSLLRMNTFMISSATASGHAWPALLAKNARVRWRSAPRSAPPSGDCSFCGPIISARKASGETSISGCERSSSANMAATALLMTGKLSYSVSSRSNVTAWISILPLVNTSMPVSVAEACMPTAPRPRSGWRLAPGQRAQRSLRWLPRRNERPGLEKARDRGAHEDATTRAHCSVAAQRSAPLSIHTEIQLDAAFPMRRSPPLSLNHVLPFSLVPVCPLPQPWIAAVYGRSSHQEQHVRSGSMTVRWRAGTRKCGPAQPCSHSVL